jgi:hypothetical protein
MVYEKGAGTSDSRPLLWQSHLGRLRRLGHSRNYWQYGRHTRPACLEMGVGLVVRTTWKIADNFDRFIIEGAITVVIASSAFFVLPNFPRTTSWLTEEERQLAVYRLQEDIGEDDWKDAESQTFFHGLKLALLDIKTWVLTILLLSIVSSASVTNFFPTVSWIHSRFRCE